MQQAVDDFDLARVDDPSVLAEVEAALACAGALQPPPPRVRCEAVSPELFCVYGAAAGVEAARAALAARGVHPENEVQSHRDGLRFPHLPPPRLLLPLDEYPHVEVLLRTALLLPDPRLGGDCGRVPRSTLEALKAVARSHRPGSEQAFFTARTRS